MRRMTLFLCVLLLSVPWAASHAQDDSPPYLYYYSDTLNSFVIERADGTDSRSFGENMMPPETNAVKGPGWSPSGQWFAWSSVVNSSDQYDSASQLHALSADGTRRLTVLDAYPHAWLAWAPQADLLLVAGQDYRPRSNPVTSERTLMLHVALINPAADAALVSLSWQVPCEVPGEVIAYPQFSSGWSSDGQHAILRYYEPLNNWSTSPRPVVVHVIGLDGSTVERRIDPPVLYWGPGIEQITTYEGTTLAVENLVTGERDVFEDAPAQISRLEWRADGRYALIFASACPEGSAAECGIDLWLLDRSEGQFSLIYPQVGFENRAYPVELPWSPGGTYAVFLTGDGSFYGLDLAKRQAERLTPPLDDPAGLQNLWQIGWSWVDDRHIVLPGVRVGDDEQAIHIYDLDTGVSDTYETPGYCCKGDFNIPHLSASGRYAAYIQETPVLVDTVTGAVQKLPPDSRSYSDIVGGEVLWHPAADWLFLASGATYPHISVINADVSVRRELTSCWDTSHCIGWLPPQVDPASLAPGHDPAPAPEPAYNLHDTHWAWYLSWSPDSARLLAGRAPFESHDDYRGGPGVSTLWDVAQGRSEGTFSLVDWDEEILWFNPDGTGYIPLFETLDEIYGSDDLAVSPDGSQRVTWLGIEDTATGAMLLDFDTGFELAPIGGVGYPAVVSYSPDGRWLAAPLSNDPTIKIWDTTTWAVLATLPGNFQAVAFSPDGRWLAASQSWTVAIWDVSTLIELGAAIQNAP